MEVSFDVECIVKKEIFRNKETGYRIVSCEPIGNTNLPLTKYGNFTVSGDNIGSMKVGNKEHITVVQDPDSKYEASYKLSNYIGMSYINGEFHVDPDSELNILKKYMDNKQAESVHEAYPNFVDMILNGKEDKIDVKEIKNVGNKRLSLYITKIKNDCRSITYFPIANKYGIKNSSDVNKIQFRFDSVDSFEKEIKENPYRIFCDILGRSFEAADKVILKSMPNMKASQCRAEYAAMEILKQNEFDGNTYITTKDFSSKFVSLVPECKDIMVSAIVDSEDIFFDKQLLRIATESTHNAECNIADHIKKRISSNQSTTEMDWGKYKKMDGMEFTSEQMEILKLIANGSKISILTGGSGTGKSSSTKAIVQMFEDNGISYQLLAPTGIAAKRLSECTGKKASTIHRYLAKSKAGIYNPVDYVVIDETGMVSVSLLSDLFDLIGYDTNIVFVCDEAQLVSIACGNIVHDILESEIVPRANLTKVFRYGTSGLATIATDTRNGTLKNIKKEFDDFNFVDIDKENFANQILGEYKKILNMGYPPSDIMILSPYNKGDMGAFAINKLIQNEFNKSKSIVATRTVSRLGELKFKIGDKIINTHNEYHISMLTDDNEIEDGELMNGDIGFVSGADSEDMIGVFDSNQFVFLPENINNLLLGYALSIHRVQGSEAKAVIVVIDKSHFRLLSNNLMYVAFSRAKERMSIIGDIDALSYGISIQENMERNTYLCDLLLDKE